MPAPLARGILLSLSLLIAAGIAVYENPQIREWIEENRRKLALALHGLGDEVHPTSSWGRDDLSLREDNSPEAVERRRQARQAILDRAREIHASRGLPLPTHRRGQSFDDLVDDEGNLRGVGGAGEATTTGTSMHDEASRAQLRNRATEAAGAAAGAAMANPFADEMVMSYNSGLSEDEALERATRASMSASESDAASMRSALSDVEMQAIVDRELQKVDRLRLHVDTALASRNATLEADRGDDDDGTSESEVLVELTPTTSRAPSSFHPAVLTPRTPRTPVALDHEQRSATLDFDDADNGSPRTPRSTASGGVLMEEPEELAAPLPAAVSSALSAADFQSIHRWAATSSSAGFHSMSMSMSESGESGISGGDDMAGLEASLARNRDVGGVSEGHGQEHEQETKRPRAEDDEDLEFLSAADARSEAAPSEAELISHGSATPGSRWSEIGSVVSDEEH